MNWLRSLNRIADLIYMITKQLIVVAMGAIVLLVGWQVFTRYVLNDTAVWATEAATLLMIWMLYLGCSLALRDGDLISLSLVTDRLPPRTRAIVKLLETVGLVAFFTAMIIINVEILQLSSTTPMPVLRIPKFWVYFSLTTGFSIMVYYLLLQLAEEIGNLGKLVSKGGN